jgi:Flp pilus assembly protein TadG
MKRLARTLSRQLARFRRNERGAAVVEFALILPFLITLYMGSIEASSLFTVDRRVEVITSTMADLVARWNPNEGVITSTTMRDYFNASKGIITPYSNTGLKQVVSFLNVAADGSAKVVWSCGFNGGAALSVNQAYALGTEMKRLVTGADDQLKNGKAGFLVAASTSYSYKPVLGMVFTSAINLQSRALFLPRFQQAVTAPNGGCPT